MSIYKAVLSNGKVINIPSTIKTGYEKIRKYGMQALIARSIRSKAFQKELKMNEVTVEYIIMPNGQTVLAIEEQQC